MGSRSSRPQTTMPPATTHRSKPRLDEAVAAQTGLTRAQARSLILAGRVRVDGEPRTKPGASIPAGAAVAVERPAPYVSRGGEKLAAALDAFALDPADRSARRRAPRPAGSPTSLLARAARSVTALDVGYGQLAWKLRGDPRVTVVERTNFASCPTTRFRTAST